jgi:4-hydroxythreonine-4-phosphate dehydrogenase
VAKGSRVQVSPTPRSLPLGISCGDPSGIGPEIILKALQRLPRLKVRVIGPLDAFERAQRRLKTGVDLSVVDDAVESPGRFEFGKVQKNCGTTALLALELGAHLLKTGEVGALVTAPVSKSALRLAGFSFPGQTEFLAQRLGARHTAMLAWTPRFKAAFVTIHLPLAHVSRHITPEAVLEKLRLLAEFLRSESSGVKRSASSDKRPPIAVLAFNPHSREFSLGEEDWIAEAVATARREGINCVGPVPADAAIASLSVSRSLGLSVARSLPRYSAFLCAYHDQAMIPAKLLGRDSGVNVTLGLGRVRTSPLHGVAFDIAGKGVANPGSMLAAVRLARRLAR